MLSPMGIDELRALRREVRADPRNVGARVRFGQALAALGRAEEGASHLRLASGLDPTNPHLGLLAASALAECGRSREAALLLSTRLAAVRSCTVVAESELDLLAALLSDKKALVRCHVARAVGRLRIDQAVPALERALGDANGAVRLAATASLKVLRAH